MAKVYKYKIKEGMSDSAIAEILGLKRSTTNRYYNKYRELMEQKNAGKRN
jgi:transposase